MSHGYGAVRDPSPATFRAVLSGPEFRAMYAAQVFSIAGDQIAKVSLAILVYDRTSSATLSALVYGLTLVPWIFAPLLASAGDRYPRRTVLIACDAARASLVAAMVITSLPLGVLLALLAGVSILAPPFESARAALLADVVVGESYVTATALTQMSLQGGQVLGFVAGGALVGAMGARGALAMDAGTFVVSALLLAACVKVRPAPAGPVPATPVPAQRVPAETVPDTPATADPAGGWTVGLRLVFGTPILRSLMLLAWTGALFAVVPEGLAVPVTRHVSGSDTAAGFLTAAAPLGLFLGVLVIGRILTPARRDRLMLPLACLCLVPFSFSGLVSGHTPGISGLFVLWLIAGVGGAFNLSANAAFVRAVPGALRSRAFGVAQAGLQLAQAAGLLIGGAAAGYVAPLTVIVLGGLVGTGVVGVVAVTWPRTKAADRPNQVENPPIT